MYAAKESGGNPKSTKAHAKVDEASALMLEAVSDLTQTLEKAGGEAGLISGTYVCVCGVGERQASSLVRMCVVWGRGRPHLWYVCVCVVWGRGRVALKLVCSS